MRAAATPQTRKQHPGQKPAVQHLGHSNGPPQHLGRPAAFAFFLNPQPAIFPENVTLGLHLVSGAPGVWQTTLTSSLAPGTNVSGAIEW